MATILDTIADYARARVAAARETVPLEELRKRAAVRIAEDARAGLPAPGEAFIAALERPGLSFICEVKKASPSKGVISENFDYLGIARDYEAAGADCMSCLTEPRWFMGSDQVFCDIRAQVRTPMLRKDFTVDEYQLFEARLMGANAVLLICSLLGDPELERYLGIARELGLAALVETHDAAEVSRAVAAGARVVGVNNRDLKTFSVDFGNAARLRELIPQGTIYVAESGVRDEGDVAALADMGADAVLVGEALMRAPDRQAALARFKAAAGCANA